MPEMTDEEFIHFYKDFYGALEMPDDEFIDCHRELEDAFDHGWDTKQYLCAWQDPNRKPYLVSKNELAAMFGVALKTVDDWERRGMPIYQRGSYGVPYEIDIAAYWEWSIAREWGVSIQEYRRIELQEEVRRKTEEDRRWAAIEAKHLVRRLTAEVSALRSEVEALKHQQLSK